MAIDIKDIIKALENLGGTAKAENISPEVAKVINMEPYPIDDYKNYRSFYGTVQAKIEHFCPDSDNYKEGTKKIFTRLGGGFYTFFDSEKEEKELNKLKNLLSEHTYFPIDDLQAIEGYKKDTVILSSKRNIKIVNERKKRDKHTCQVCGFVLNISDQFVIECHHLNPLSESGEVKTTIEDLISLCPTCHRIAHLRNPPYSPQEIKELAK